MTATCTRGYQSQLFSHTIKLVTCSCCTLTCCKGTFLFEVERHNDDRGNVNHGQSEARQQAERDVEHLKTVHERTGDEAEARDHSANHARFATAVAIGQGTSDGPRQQRYRHKQRAHHRRLALALVEDVEELGVEDAERERAAVGDHVRAERGEHDGPAPPPVGRGRQAQAARAAAHTARAPPRPTSFRFLRFGTTSLAVVVTGGDVTAFTRPFVTAHAVTGTSLSIR